MSKQNILMTCGLNYKTAPVHVREKIIFPSKSLPDSLKAFAFNTGLDNVVILSTCNRTEIYFYLKASEKIKKLPKILPWLSNYHALELTEIQPHVYFHQNKRTLKHALRVAAGLDSMVLGETQILGQLKKAVSVSDKTGTLGNSLRNFFEHIFFAAKEIRTQTKIGLHSVSLGHAVMRLAKTIFENAAECRVLFIGAGEAVRLTAQYFHSQNISGLSVANRTLANAEKMSEIFKENIMTLESIPERLHEFDIIISGIGLSSPVIGKGLAETALKRRKRRPMLMIDLALPRNIEPEIKSLTDIYLYHMDELQYLLQENFHKRESAIQSAESMITDQTEKFYDELTLLKSAKAIQSYRSKAGKIRDTVLKKALKALTAGENPEKVLQKTAYILTNKLAHDPCLWLKKAALKNYAEVIEMALTLADETNEKFPAE